VFIMVNETATARSTLEPSEEKAGFDQTEAQGPIAEWQKIITDLLAEIAWGTDPTSETVQRLAWRGTEALNALARGGAGRVIRDHTTRT
jgi:hypothetical protein